MNIGSDQNCYVTLGVSIATGVVIVVPILVWLRKHFEGGQFLKLTKMTNKVVLITGGNTGIGKQTALDLANRGAKVYIACRDHNRGESARLEIIAKTGNENVFNRKLDLASFESIKTFATDFTKEEQKLDVLINNAGYGHGAPRQLTEEKFEMCLGVNHLGHFLLTNLLLEQVKKASPSRIVVVASRVHENGTINKEDLNSEKSYHSMGGYCQSKLANILFSKQLAIKLSGTGVVVNSLHPGVVDTEFFRNLPMILMPLLTVLKWFFLKTAKSGAQTTIRLAVDPELETVTGKYFMDCIETNCAKQAKDDETAEWLWKKSEELTNVKY